MKKRLWAIFMAVALITGPAIARPAAADELAWASTPLGNSSDAKIDNIKLAVWALDGTYVGEGEEFSFNRVVGPRTKDEGYRTAENGRGVKIVGGGCAQVATTLYLALKEIDYSIIYKEKSTYNSRFADGYVSSGKDAIIVDYAAGTDFRFVNDYGGFTINMWLSDGELYCTLEDADINGGFDDSGYIEEGYGNTPIDGNSALHNNIELCADSIYDTTLTNDEVFSFNNIVGPREERYGYEGAINGRGVKVIGGGVAQVASTVWLAVKDMDCIEIVEKSTYGSRYNQKYVRDAKDAILTDYAAKTDFKFRYTGYGTLSIYTYVSGDTVYCDVYETE